MPSRFSGAQIDFYSPLSQLGENIGEGLGEYRKKKRRSDVFSKHGTDYASAVDELMQYGDMEGAAAAAKVYGVGGFADSGHSQFGLNPFYAMDADGNLKAYQLNSGGGMQELPLNGMRPAPGVQFLNQGTQFQGVDKRSGAPIGDSVPIDVAGERAAQEKGASEQKAKINLPGVENATRRLIQGIESIEKSPGLSNATGVWQSKLPTLRQSTADAEAKIEQATSGGFLQMYEAIRGAGQITESEGAKASGALFRLAQLKQGDEAYSQALAEAKFEVFELANLARMKAGVAPQPNPYAGQNTTSMTRTPQPQAPANPSVDANAGQIPQGRRPLPSQQQLQLLAQYANDPEAIAAFDEIYGAGAADHFLQGGR